MKETDSITNSFEYRLYTEQKKCLVMRWANHYNRLLNQVYMNIKCFLLVETFLLSKKSNHVHYWQKALFLLTERQ